MLQAVIDSIVAARELRPDSAEAWSSLGLTYVMAWRWKDAWTALNAARRRGPTLAQTELGFALSLLGPGEADKVKRARGSRSPDPLNAEMADWGTGPMMVGERDAARTWAERKMRQHPDIGLVFSGAGVGASIAGDHERAVKLAEHGAEPRRLAGRADHAGPGLRLCRRQGQVAAPADRAGRAGTYTCPYESAAAPTSRSATKRAIALLGDAVEKRSNCLCLPAQRPAMERHPAGPRFAVLLRRVGLDDASLATYKR